jgi:hypothetical protein
MENEKIGNPRLSLASRKVSSPQRENPSRSPLRNGSLFLAAYLRYNRGDRFLWEARPRSPLRLRAPIASDNREVADSFCCPTNLSDMLNDKTRSLSYLKTRARSPPAAIGSGLKSRQTQCLISLPLHDLWRNKLQPHPVPLQSQRRCLPLCRRLR